MGSRDRLALCEIYENRFGKLVDAFGDRVLPIDAEVARIWGEMIGRQYKNRFDLCVAATAKVHGMVVATRNLADFIGRGVPVLDPFEKNPRIAMP